MIPHNCIRKWPSILLKEEKKRKLFKLSWVFRWKCWVLLEFSDVGDITMRLYGHAAFISSVHKPHNMIMAPKLVSPLLQCFTFCCHIFSPWNSFSTKRRRLQELVIRCDPFLGEKLVIPTKNTNILSMYRIHFNWSSTQLFSRTLAA